MFSLTSILNLGGSIYKVIDVYWRGGLSLHKYRHFICVFSEEKWKLKAKSFNLFLSYFKASVSHSGFSFNVLFPSCLLNWFWNKELRIVWLYSLFTWIFACSPQNIIWWYLKERTENEMLNFSSYCHCQSCIVVVGFILRLWFCHTVLYLLCFLSGIREGIYKNYTKWFLLTPYRKVFSSWSIVYTKKMLQILSVICGFLLPTPPEFLL